MNNTFSSDWIEELKSRNDIVYVISKYCNLNKKGKYYWTCCPFHFEKTPSMAVDEVEQYFHCYGCGAGGDVITFIQKIESVDFYDACKILAENAGMKLPSIVKDENIAQKKKEREEIYAVLRDCALYYYNNLKLESAKPANEYIQKRRLNPETITSWGIGYSLGWNQVVEYLTKKGYKLDILLKAGIVEEKNGKIFDAYAKRLIFPIINSFGNVVGFSGRMLENADFAKYKNTAQTAVFDKSKCVFGINMIKKAKNLQGLKEIIIVEGQMDVISLHQAGVKNAVATLGTALTSFHAKEIKRFCDKVVVCFDGDGAGKKATLRSLDILVNAGLDVYVASLPTGVDPDEFIISYGKEKFLTHIANAKHWVEYLIYSYYEKYNMQKSNEKASFVSEALALIRTLKSESEQNIYLDLVKNLTNISMDVLRSDLKNEMPKQTSEPLVKKQEEQRLVFENAYVKATKFIMASILHKKPYAKLTDEIRQNIINPDYIKIYDYFLECYANNKKPIIGAVFERFDADNNNDVLDLINYEFIESEDNENFFDGCVKQIVISGLNAKQKEITEKLSTIKDLNERKQLITELNDIILKIKGLKN